MQRSLVGSEMCIRDSIITLFRKFCRKSLRADERLGRCSLERANRSAHSMTTSIPPSPVNKSFKSLVENDSVERYFAISICVLSWVYSAENLEKTMMANSSGGNHPIPFTTFFQNDVPLRMANRSIEPNQIHANRLNTNAGNIHGCESPNMSCSR